MSTERQGSLPRGRRYRQSWRWQFREETLFNLVPSAGIWLSDRNSGNEYKMIEHTVGWVILHLPHHSAPL